MGQADWNWDECDHSGFVVEAEGDLSELWRRGWYFIYAESSDPLSGNGIPFFHRHAGIGVKHLGTSATAPGEEAEKVVFTDGPGPGWGIRFRQTIRHAATRIQHADSSRDDGQYAGVSCQYSRLSVSPLA